MPMNVLTVLTNVLTMLTGVLTVVLTNVLTDVLTNGQRMANGANGCANVSNECVNDANGCANECANGSLAPPLALKGDGVMREAPGSIPGAAPSV